MRNYLLILLILIFVKMHGQLAAADSLLAIGDYKNAIEIYKTTDDSYFKLARAYSQLGEVHNALSSYQDGFKKDSASLRPRFEYARLSLGNNDPATAFDVFDKLIVEFPENATYRYYMGKTYNDLGRVEDAVSSFAKAVSLNASYRAADQFYADKTKKLEFYEQFVTQYPNSSYMEYVDARRKDLRKEIFLAAKK
ncbi:tetratricopeptide repeat protein [Nonlabens sp.]|uniref:tetratricopeptide repeat protein n=1 Tax=Nonlabens sp. TaxID=1888209 RepID=UPI0032661F83